jgi:glycosyltransferase involved in cell wall biosynthesis
MKVSGFTFLRNGVKLGYPFAESIRSVLPIVDEFVIALGPSDDGTRERIEQIADPKIRIIDTQWNETIRNDLNLKGYVYGQQKSIALFNCTGDWAFYLEGDELLHEDDLPKIRESMERHLNDQRVEALYFDYIHFYANRNTYVWSPSWYRTAPRIVRNNITVWAPKGLFFIVMDNKRRGRYPRAAAANARIFHYGNIRSQEQWDLKTNMIYKFWNNSPNYFKYGDLDPQILRPFTGTHPKAVQGWLPPADGVYEPPPGRRLTFDDYRHRLMARVESWFNLDFTHKHYRRVSGR